MLGRGRDRQLSAGDSLATSPRTSPTHAPNRPVAVTFGVARALIGALAVPRLPLGKPFRLLQSRQELEKLVRKRRVDEIVIVGSQRPPKGVDSPRVERGVIRFWIVGWT